MSRKVTVKGAIASRLIVDFDGGLYNRGMEHAFTVDDIIKDVGLKPTSRTRPVVQSSINVTLRDYRANEVLAGGIGRSPTYYLIADTLEEEQQLLSRYLSITKCMMKGVNGRATLSALPAVEALVISINSMIQLVNDLTMQIEAPIKEETL